MLKDYRCRAVLGLALVSAVFASGSIFAQDDARKASGKSPVSTRSIRPFVRSETAANQAPNLYDKSSEEFNYFREDLGRQELSSRQKARMEQIAKREVYADPMDKPAADGSPFVDIYSPDEVFEDGEPFVGLDDPDVIYADDEKNLLAKFSAVCDVGSALITLAFRNAASNENDLESSRNASAAPPLGPPMSMPTPTMDPRVTPGAGLAGMADSKDSSEKAPEKKAEPIKADDTALIFPGGVDDPNPFDGKMDAVEGDFDLFKADREFVVKETAPQGGMMGSMGGNASEGLFMGTPPEMMGGISRSPEPSGDEK